MARPKNPTTPPQIMDVAHPGKSAPSPNARHVIINNRQMAGDPMVTAKKINVIGPADHDTPERPVAAAPLFEPAAAATAKAEPQQPPAETAAALPALPAEVLTRPEQPAEAEPQAKKPEISSQITPPPDHADNKASDKAEVAKERTVEDAEAEAARRAEHEAKIQKLVDGKQYFLPINAIEKRRSAHFVALGIFISLVLAVAWVDVALDAGLIHLAGIKPVTHIFTS